jgi:hypothetical protein
MSVFSFFTHNEIPSEEEFQDDDDKIYMLHEKLEFGKPLGYPPEFA